MTTVGNNALHIILDLAQYPTQTKITRVWVENVLSSLSRESEDRGVDEGCADSSEGCRTTRVPHKWNVLASQGHQRHRDVRKIRDNAPVVAHRSQELAYTLETIRDRPRFDVLNLDRVALQASPTNNVSQKRHR